MRTGPQDNSSRAERRELLGRRQRRLAWIGFLLLAAYSPLVAWLDPGDTWMAPVAVAATVGYVIVIDDVLRHRAARTATSDGPVASELPPDLPAPGSSQTDSAPGSQDGTSA